MTKREIVEQLKENRPNFKGDEEEIEVKTALYIYIELGKIKSFDENYYWGNSETQKKIYQLAERESRKPDEMSAKRKIICVSLSHLYCSILKEFGITAMVSPKEEDGHVYPIITTKKNTRLVADLQLDLENIQTKSRIEHFEYLENTSSHKKGKVNQEVLTQMLIEIGYIAKESDYKNEELERLAEKIKGQNPHEALQTILEDEKLYEGNKDMGIIEINKFYKGVLKKLVGNFWGKRIFAFNCYRKKEDDEKDYTLCVFSEEDTIRPYLFSKKQRKFLKADISRIRQLQEEGLVLGARPRENGANKLKKYINRKIREEKVK